MRPYRLLSAFCLVIAAGCSSENEPSVMSGNETSGSGGAGAPSSSAGKPATGAGTAGGMAQTGTSGTASPSGAAGRSSSGAGGSTTSGSAGSGMSASAGSGMSAAAGMSSSASAGMSSSAGAGAGGSSGGAAGETGAMSGGQFSPLCSAVPMTAAGEVPTKGGACTEADPQLCYKTCGPQSIGFKSETCMNGAYVEQSGCSFPDADYACYKIPAMIDAAKCPAMTPQATMPCEVDACTLCNLNGNYLDSSGAEKAGYCVCPMAGAAGSRKWSCASTTAWPCPTGKGC